MRPITKAIEEDQKMLQNCAAKGKAAVYELVNDKPLIN
jgi:hypothetical protein